MIWKYILLWFGLVLLAILNGLFREKVLRHFLNELTGHQVSTLTFIIVTGTYIWAFSHILPLESSGQALVIGSIWTGMTIVFEFGFGHYFMKHPWSRLFADYNLLKGRLWVVALIWTLVSPLVFFLI
ncbi:MAG: hypothetical protein JW712_11225 [Dehalococcoidales bacterium]|nr:hypothetical protein [Dehalococcoidales bacterium]